MRRLRKEFRDLQEDSKTSEDASITLAPEDDNMHRWNATIRGPDSTPYKVRSHSPFSHERKAFLGQPFFALTLCPLSLARVPLHALPRRPRVLHLSPTPNDGFINRQHLRALGRTFSPHRLGQGFLSFHSTQRPICHQNLPSKCSSQDW